MGSLGYAEAFAKYGARLKNVNWSVCAEGRDDSLVVSLWQHHFRKEGDALVCRDTMARWSGAGKNELRERLANAFRTKQKIRVVMAVTPHPELVDQGGDASDIPKTFHLREDLVGWVTELDGECFAIRFSRDDNRTG